MTMFNDGGNPTCQYCGVTYGIAEIHNCVAKQEALRKRKEESISYLEKELSKAQITLRDQFAMAALTGMCSSLNFINGQSTEAMCAVAYDYADVMLRVRGQKA